MPPVGAQGGVWRAPRSLVLARFRTRSSASLSGVVVLLAVPPASHPQCPFADSGQGFVYSGQIEKGQMHGKGTLVYPNGEKYEVWNPACSLCCAVCASASGTASVVSRIQ
jgi:hypothetical protein